jgi:hypothetical protein
MSLDKKCIQKVFPEMVPEEDRCDKPRCRGYDKFCPNYAPSSSLDLRKYEDMLDFRDNLENSGI